jgi:hypothetical protein
MDGEGSQDADVRRGAAEVAATMLRRIGPWAETHVGLIDQIWARLQERFPHELADKQMLLELVAEDGSFAALIDSLGGDGNTRERAIVFWNRDAAASLVFGLAEDAGDIGPLGNVARNRASSN